MSSSELMATNSLADAIKVHKVFQDGRADELAVQLGKVSTRGRDTANIRHTSATPLTLRLPVIIQLVLGQRHDENRMLTYASKVGHADLLRNTL